MNQFLSFDGILSYQALTICSASLSLLLIFKTIKSTFFLSNKVIKDTPVKSTRENQSNFVDIYLFLGNGACVSCSPYSTKIIMFLRLAGIPHKTHKAKFEDAPNSKVPYLKHGSAFFGDSQLIIRYLENTYDIPKMISTNNSEGLSKFLLFNQLTKEQKALSDMIRITCESDIYWSIHSIHWSGKFGIGKSEKLWDKTKSIYFSDIPSFIRGPITAMIRVMTLQHSYGNGFVRKSPNDQLYLAKRAVEALSNILDKKLYFLGDFLSECDCMAYSSLECALDDSSWPNELSDYIKKECTNLVDYVARVKRTVFEDVFRSNALLPPSRLEGKIFIRD
eukprot:gene9799-13182_t